MTKRLLPVAVLALLSGLSAGLSPLAAAAPPVDVELVFAVDASDSMEDWEWRLEMSGIAAAFRSKSVRQVIASLPHHQVAVALVVWADTGQRADVSDWTLVDGAATADDFAALAEAWPRRVGGGTGMGEGIAAAVRLIERAPFAAGRRIIDVSGDGPEPLPLLSEAIVLMPQARAMAERAHVTVNGLAILKDRPDLFDWYQDYVATGPGAFVMRIKDARDFAPAFEQKVLRELQLNVAQLGAP